MQGPPALRSYLGRLPFIAILRGISPEDVVPIGRVLVAAGFAVIEVPLNSPDPLESIRRLAAALSPDCLIGAGTVTDAASVSAIAEAGGRLIVMPHSDPIVLAAAKRAGLFCAPGVATPTEAFAALANGADALKLFPAELLGPAVVKAWRSVIPPQTILLPVGGITPQGMHAFIAAGASGFGLGSALYKPGSSAAQVAENAGAFTAAWRSTQLARSAADRPQQRV